MFYKIIRWSEDVRLKEGKAVMMSVALLLPMTSLPLSDRPKTPPLERRTVLAALV